MHPDTLIAANHAETHLIKDYAKFNSALKLLNDARIRSASQMQEALNKMFSTSFNNAGGRRERGRITTNYTSAHPCATAEPGSSARLPPLTAAERALLQAHEGCFKCCRPYAEHLVNACPNGFPEKATYKTLTEADTLAVKKKHGKAMKAAAVLPVAASIPAPVAVAPVAVVMPSVVLGNGSDSDCVTAPFFIPHFFLDCRVGGDRSSTQTKVHALIDHGCDSVLISPELADAIGLKRHRLPKPKEVVMTVGKKNETFVFEEWSKLTVVSLDQS